jgi:hypothetical protein
MLFLKRKIQGMFLSTKAPNKKKTCNVALLAEPKVVLMYCLEISVNRKVLFKEFHLEMFSG